MATKNSKPTFIPGLELAEAFYREAVAPILQTYVPELKYSAALLGPGSEILGFDDEMSTDHHWGPRVMLFLEPAVLEKRERAIYDLLAVRLPYTFRTYPTNWTAPNPNDNGTQGLHPVTEGPISHRVEMLSINGFFSQYMGLCSEKPLRAVDWLTLPWQKLRSIAVAQIFHDELDLAAICARFQWYPDDIWLYLLASCWSRIGQEEHLMGRAGLVGDEIGSSIIASRLVRDIMRFAFLMERTYPPYSKWFGSAFNQLASALVLLPLLSEILAASSWQERDCRLAVAYQHIAEMHNALAVTAEVSALPSLFFGRPFQVIAAGRFVQVLREAIQDEAVKTIAKERLIGNIDLVSDNTDLLEDPTRREALLELYR